MRALVCSILLVPLGFSASCKEEKAKPTASADAGVGPHDKVPLIARRISQSPIIISTPDGWPLKSEVVALPARKPGDEVGPIVLRSRTLLSSRPASPDAGDPWLMVMHDPHLPTATDATAYLDAQRASNRQSFANLKHVEAERSKLNGRPTYTVRDQWSITLDDKEQLFSQEALLILDKKSKPGETHGYAIVFTRTEQHRENDPLLGRRILESVRFAE